MSRKVDLTDPDNPEWTEEMFARARPAREVLSRETLKAFKRPPGRPRAAAPKPVVSIRLDPEVLAWFKAKGPGWQTHMQEVLAKAAGKG